MSYYGAAKGDWRPRAFTEDEDALSLWGSETGDLHINDEICFANVPEAVWGLELGGYPVLKKWLGYRQANRQGGRPLTLAEARYFRSMIQRLAALLALQPELDALSSGPDVNIDYHVELHGHYYSVPHAGPARLPPIHPAPGPDGNAAG